MKTMLDVVGAVKDYVDTHAGGGGGGSKVIKGVKTPSLIRTKTGKRFVNKNWVATRTSGTYTVDETAYFSSDVWWTDGVNIYGYAKPGSSSASSVECVYNKENGKFVPRSGCCPASSSFREKIWTDGFDFYFPYGSSEYKLFNKSSMTWETKSWSDGGGVGISSGLDVWTDGVNIYYSSNGNNYQLDKSIMGWSTKTWSGYTSPVGRYIWTDGDNIYYSYNSNQYVLDVSTSTWSTKTWNGFNPTSGNSIWTDGDNIYYSSSTYQYILDKDSSTWVPCVWDEQVVGSSIWMCDGEIYQGINKILVNNGAELR